MIIFGSSLPSALGWLVTTKVYSGTGADIVMESIPLVENWPVCSPVSWGFGWDRAPTRRLQVEGYQAIPLVENWPVCSPVSWGFGWDRAPTRRLQVEGYQARSFDCELGSHFHHGHVFEGPSRPGELHPEPLTDPDVNLSIHPARATPREGCRLPSGHGVPPVTR